jgi:hypothetical protein
MPCASFPVRQIHSTESLYETRVGDCFVDWSGRATGICRRHCTLCVPAAISGRELRAWAGNIMEAIQWRHIKLAYAGRSANWELASYVLGQMQESLSDAARLYQGIPIEEVDMIEQPMMALSDAIKSKDGPRFTRAFADLTSACNSCHAAARASFITIQVPTASPFTDQSFSYKGK